MVMEWEMNHPMLRKRAKGNEEVVVIGIV